MKIIHLSQFLCLSLLSFAAPLSKNIGELKNVGHGVFDADNESFGHVSGGGSLLKTRSTGDVVSQGLIGSLLATLGLSRLVRNTVQEVNASTLKSRTLGDNNFRHFACDNQFGGIFNKRSVLKARSTDDAGLEEYNDKRYGEDLESCIRNTTTAIRILLKETLF